MVGQEGQWVLCFRFSILEAVEQEAERRSGSIVVGSQSRDQTPHSPPDERASLSLPPGGRCGRDRRTIRSTGSRHIPSSQSRRAAVPLSPRHQFRAKVDWKKMRGTNLD